MGVLAGLACVLAAARGQTVTWVLPSDETESGLRLESAAPGVEADLLQGLNQFTSEDDADYGEPIKTVAPDWKFEDHPVFGPTLRSGRGRDPDGTLHREWSWGSGRTKIVKITDLPAGEHEVFIRYWSEIPSAERAGQNHWVLRAGLADGKNRWLSAEAEGSRIVRGLGGYHGGIYEVSLGTVAAESRDATEVSVQFHRYRYGRVARFGGIRIETRPNADAPRTGGPGLSADERRVRERLLAGTSADEGGYGYATVPAGVGVRPKRLDDLIGVETGERFLLTGARNEWVSAQAVMLSPKRDLQGVELTTSALRERESGREIPAGRVDFAPVGYLFNDAPYDVEKHGWWPEPILISDAVADFPVPQGDLRALWLRIHIPKDAEPGIYEGRATIAPDDGPSISIPVAVKVYDFAIPDAYHFRTAISASGPHAGSTWALSSRWLLDYGINPGSLYSSRSPTEEEFRRMAEDGRVNAFNVGAYTSAATPPDREQLDAMLDQIGTALATAEKYGLRDKAYYYCFDEAKEAKRAAMQKVTSAVHERFPELLILTTAHVNPEQFPQVRGWVPRIPAYQYEKARKLREQGREVWWYVSGASPFPPVVSLYVTQSPMAHRLLMGFMAYGYGSDGFLYYAMTKGWKDWSRASNVKPAITSIYAPREIWPVNNVGQLVQYGGQRDEYGVRGLPNLRLEMMRAGLQDYEYLRLAEERWNALEPAERTPGLTERYRAIQAYFEPGNPLYEDFANFARAPDELAEVRRQLARFIERAGKRDR